MISIFKLGAVSATFATVESSGSPISLQKADVTRAAEQSTTLACYRVEFSVAIETRKLIVP